MFKYQTKIPKSFKEFIGKTLTLKDGRKIVVESIVGNRITPTNFEVNGEFLISFLRAYSQLYGADDVTEADLEAFESQETHVHKINDKKIKEVKSESVSHE